jgi:cyclic-di-GMP-binding protein
MPLDVPAAPHALAAGPPKGAADEAFRALLPGADPLAAQSLLCKELSRLAAPAQSGDAVLRAVLALDAHAQHVGKRLLAAYAEGDDQLRAFDARYLISARLLSRSFAQAYERLLAYLQANAGKATSGDVVTVIVQLFRHRQAELLLRLLRYKRHSSEQWRQLYAAYRYAQASALEHEPFSGPGDRDVVDGRGIHQHFIEMLLLGALNTGQLSPRELLWASHWLAGWSSLLTLRPSHAGDAAQRSGRGFVVDFAGSEGLTRLEPGEAADLHLDTAALMSSIDEEIAALNRSVDDDPVEPSAARQASIALLSKLRILYAPEAVQFTRRGERMSVATPVQTMCALGNIVRIVREEAQSRGRGVATQTRQAPAITISPNSGYADSFPGTVFHAASPAPLTISTTTTARPPGTWQARDWSDSGCRLRGRATDLNEVIPGSLMAIREEQDAPWTVAIVRRLRRLMVDHVEISLEFIGRKPRYIKLVGIGNPPPAAGEAPSPKRKPFGAIYLPLSERRPTLPIKTLVVPVAAFDEGQVATLFSSEARYSVRFNKALEHHADFVWTTFTLIARR